MVDNFGDRLVEQIRKTNSFLCIGIDPHLDLIPEIFYENETNNNIKIVERFCFSLLEAFIGKVPAVKPQIALFEQLGPEGMILLSSLCKYAHSKGYLIIMDAKRGDIGSTSKAYAKAYLGKNAPFPSDALTVNPWLGLDSLEPFFSKAQDTGSGLFILVHTSNKGSQDIQEILIHRDLKCYEHLAYILKPVIEKNNGQSGLSSVGIVCGATYREQAISLRKILPSAPFLIPGYGAQGASASEACAPLITDQSNSKLKNFGLINASRSVLFPKNSYLVNSTKEWQDIISKEVEKTNDILINTKT